MELHELSVRDLASQIAEGSISARETTDYFLRRIELHNPSLGAVVALDQDLSMGIATKIDNRRTDGEFMGPLAGVPFVIKDLEDCAGFRTTKGSALFRNAPPATTDSLLVERLRNAGAIPIGKSNTPEFGWKGTTENLIFAPARNPYDTRRTAGGSSGGTASAVSAGLVPFGTASDGGGSIRIPAAACGIAGLKPSTGRVPIRGSRAPSWWEFATHGPMARSVSDTALLYDICKGPHIDDLRSLPKDASDWSVEILARGETPRIGVSFDLGFGTTDSEIRGGIAKAADALSDAGFAVVDLPPLLDEAPAKLWVKIVAAYHARTLGYLVGSEDFGLLDPGLAETIEHGMNLLARDFIGALDKMWAISAEFFARVQGVDMVLCPTTAGLPPIIGELGEVNGIPVVDWISYTALANMTRTPAATICVGMAGIGVPISAQIMGMRFSEIGVLRVAAFLESHFGLASPEIFAS